MTTVPCVCEVSLCRVLRDDNCAMSSSFPVHQPLADDGVDISSLSHAKSNTVLVCKLWYGIVYVKLYSAIVANVSNVLCMLIIMAHRTSCTR